MCQEVCISVYDVYMIVWVVCAWVLCVYTICMHHVYVMYERVDDVCVCDMSKGAVELFTHFSS